MDAEMKQNLLQQFQGYLDNFPEQEIDMECKDASTDLYGLFSEMTALKSEVRSEARLMKTALDEFKGAFALVEQANVLLKNDLEECRRQKSEMQKKTLRPVLLALCDIYDRLDAGLVWHKGYKPSLFASLCSRERGIITATAQGQEMSQERLRQLLSEFQVEPLNAVGKPFDPAIMRAVESGEDPKFADGTVTAELRQGFIWNSTVLRLAEVRVNKTISGTKI